MPKQTYPAYLFGFLLLLVASCVTQPQKTNPQTTTKEIYEAGKTALSNDDFPGAIQQFRNLDVNFPDEPHAIQAQIELAYAYYRSGDTSSTIATAERFIRKHPDNPNVDYLYYLRGLASYDETIDFISRQEAELDPLMPPMSNLTIHYFTELTDRFPSSKYAQDAQIRLKHIRERLAGFELQRAKAAIERNDYATAALHARAVMENYQGSSHDREAAALTNMVYRMLDIEGTQGQKKNIVIPMEGKAPSSTIKARPRTVKAPAPNIANEIPSNPDLQSRPSQTAVAAADHPVTISQKTVPGIKQEAWLLQQSPNTYTLQLLGTANEQALINFARRHQIEDQSAYFSTSRDGRPWYSLVYGAYPDSVSARSAAKALPSKLRGLNPWPRSLQDIQAQIDESGAGN